MESTEEETLCGRQKNFMFCRLLNVFSVSVGEAELSAVAARLKFTEQQLDELTAELSGDVGSLSCCLSGPASVSDGSVFVLQTD